MKQIKKGLLLLLTLAMLSGIICLFPFKAKAAKYTYEWISAFENDMDGDGEQEMLPYIFRGTTTVKREYFYTQSNCVPFDVVAYGGPTPEDDAKWEEMYNHLYDDHGYDAYLYFEEYEYLPVLAEMFGEGTDEYNEVLAEVREFLAFDYDYNERYNDAYQKWQTDVKEFQAQHPEVVFGHTVNDALTKCTTNPDDVLLYWLHVPYDYNPDKSYPVLILAHGEDSTLKTSRFINPDGSYKADKFEPLDAYQQNTIMSSWYNLVKEPGASRDKYDCFIINFVNTNEFFRGGGGIGIVNQYNDNALPDAHVLTTEETGDTTTYKASYSRTYVADELSPAYQEQLLCQLIDSMMEDYNIDPSRQYIAGFSLGGILTMDIISHYPDRFACAVPVCSASADITEENCKALTYTNVWAISGNGDSTCNKYFSKLFVDKINECREKFGTGTNHVAQYSFFPGGHSGGQVQCKPATANAGVSMTTKTQFMEFIFESQREDMSIAEYKSTNLQVKDMVTRIYNSPTLQNGKFDILIVGSDFVGNYQNKGFVVSVTYDDGSSEAILLDGGAPSQSIISDMRDNPMTVSANECDAISIYSHTIKNVPSDVVKIRVMQYASNGSGEFYGTPVTYLLSYDDGNVVTENITECENHHFQETSTASCEESGMIYNTCLRCGYYYTTPDEGGCRWSQYTCTRDNDAETFGVDDDEYDLIYAVCNSSHDKHMAIWSKGKNTVITKADVAKVMTDTIEEVAVMDGITAIDEGAFEGYYNIKKVVLPDTLTDIGQRAFVGTNIAEITIPTGVSVIDGGSFESRTLKKLIVPGLTGKSATIGNFISFTALEELVIERHAELETFAFQGCSSLREIDVTGVTFCGAVAFQCCTSLTKVWLSNTLTGVEETHTYTHDTGAWIFDGCYNLTDIYVEAPLTTEMLGTGTAAGWYGSIFRRYVSRKDGTDFGTPYYENTSEYYYQFTDLVTTIHWGCTKMGDDGAYTTTVHR